MRTKKGYILTTKECLEKGGHKFDFVSAVMELEDRVQIFRLNDLTRTCIYCGQEQRGHYNSVTWTDK